MVGAKSEQSERLAAEEAAAGNAGRFELGVRCAVGRDESGVAEEGSGRISLSVESRSRNYKQRTASRSSRWRA